MSGTFQNLCNFEEQCSTCPSQSAMFVALIYTIFGFSRDKKTFRKVPEEFDFIIVGAGSAGCVLANRLTEINNWKVLLLEAGIEELKLNEVPGFATLMSKSNVDWKYQSESESNSCRANGGCSLFTGRVMGGSSSINGLMYIRGSPLDFDTWAKLGNKGWSYKEVLPYFKKSENNRNNEIVNAYPQYHNKGGPLTVERFKYKDLNSQLISKAWNELGHKSVDFNADQQIGVMISQTTSLNGQRQSTNAAFIRPIRNKRPNLFIETEALVTRILIDPQTMKAIGVEYTKFGQNNAKFDQNDIKSSQTITVKTRKEVIVSAGAMNSPKLLMLSGIGPKEELEKHKIDVIKDLPVGRNLQDHATLDGLNIKLSNKTAPLTNCNNNIKNLNQYLQSKDGPFASAGPLDCIIMVKTKFETSVNVPDIEYVHLASDGEDLAFSNSYHIIKIMPSILSPNSKGYITLNSTNPVKGAPKIHLGLLNDDLDRKRLLEGIRILLDLFKTDVFRTNGMELDRKIWQLCRKWEFNSDDYWLCMMREYTASAHHFAGSCKMGPKTDKEAVVDQRLKVYGMKNLRVVDASIMPKITRGNTNAPTIMIAEKASDMIKNDWYL